MARTQRTAEELKSIRPKRGRRYVTELHAQLAEKGTAKQESFLDDPSMIDDSMAELPNYRRPTMNEMMERHKKNVEDRAREYASMGRSGKELFGPLPPIPVPKPTVRHDITSSSESEAELDKENDTSVMEEEKETDETTPVAQSQRSTGRVSIHDTSNAAPSIPSTPPARPHTSQHNSFRKPELPAREKNTRIPPRHSTPKRTVSHRTSLGSAFDNISIIANNSIVVPRGASTESTTIGSVDLRRESIGEEEEERMNESHRRDEHHEEVNNATFDVISRIDGAEERKERDHSAVANGTFVVAVRDGTLDVNRSERREEEEEEKGPEVQVAIASISIRRQSVPSGDATIGLIVEESEEGIEEREEEKKETKGREEEEEEEESMEMDDVEMESVVQTPQRPAATRVAKRPSFEHPLDASASPMAITMANRNSGRRETMIRPRLSVQSKQSVKERKKSTESVGSIKFDDISQDNMSMESGTSSFEDPKTPQRTPRTDRLYRQSILACQQRQSQQQRLEIVEEAPIQGGRRREESEDEEEEEEGETPMRPIGRNGGEERRETMIRSTPTNGLPKLSQKLQSSVDRLSQPRHRVEARPCAKLHHSPARAQKSPLPRRATMISPSPRRHPTTFNISRTTIGGYTPNGRVDTTLMEDMAGNAKSGMAPRIKKIPRRPTAVLDMSTGSIEDERREREHREEAIGTHDETRAKETPITTPITTPVYHNNYNDTDDSHQSAGFADNNQSMHSSVGGGSLNDTASIFARPFDPPTPTGPQESRRSSVLSNGSRRRDWSDDAGEELDRLSTRASQISIADESELQGASRAARAASSTSSLDLPATPKTPFRRFQARNSDLYSTDTPGIDRTSFANTEDEEEWAEGVDSVVWRGDASTASDENEADPADETQITRVEEKEETSARVLAPRKLIKPTASPGVRRSTRTRMKPVRTWLGEKAKYAMSPSTGGLRLVGVNKVVIKDKLFCKTGTADIVDAVVAKKKTERQRRIATKKRKAQKALTISDDDDSD